MHSSKNCTIILKIMRLINSSIFFIYMIEASLFWPVRFFYSINIQLKTGYLFNKKQIFTYIIDKFPLL